jgi:hypothetical protein
MLEVGQVKGSGGPILRFRVMHSARSCCRIACTGLTLVCCSAACCWLQVGNVADITAGVQQLTTGQRQQAAPEVPKFIEHAGPASDVSPGVDCKVCSMCHMHCCTADCVRTAVGMRFAAVGLPQ